MKYFSRKFIVAMFVMAMSIIVPILFKKMEIESDITMISMFIVIAMGSAYGGLNLLSKKMGLKE